MRTTLNFKGFLARHIVLAILPALVLSRPCALAQAPIWTRGVVPFVFSADFPEDGKPAVLSAMHQWMFSLAAVEFVEYPDVFSLDRNKPYLVVQLKSASEHQHTDGAGPATPRRCYLDGTTAVGEESHYVHELGHVLGFPHEQQRPDRDTHVTVHQENLGDPGQFTRLAATNWPAGSLNQPYDCLSIMHYDHCTFSKYDGESGHCDDPSKDTMTATDPDYQFQMGSWLGVDLSQGLSVLDVVKVQSVYGHGLWVGSSCDPDMIEDGSPYCRIVYNDPFHITYDTYGPYTTIASGVNAVPYGSALPYSVMIRPGTYTTAGTLRIAKPMKLVAPAGGVRLD